MFYIKSDQKQKTNETELRLNLYLLFTLKYSETRLKQTRL